MPEILRLLGNGKEFGLRHINYTYQGREGGDASRWRWREYFAEGEPICVVLGDNIIEKNIIRAVRDFKKFPAGAKDPFEGSA